MAFRLRRLLLLGAAAALLLGACSGESASLQEEVVYQFALSPAALPAGEALGVCAAQALGANEYYRVESLFPSQMDARDQDLVLTLGSAPEDFPVAAQIGQESLFIITHPSNPAGQLGQDQLRAVFSGTSESWADLGGGAGLIQVWVPTESDESRRYLEDELMAGAPISSNAKIASSPERILNAVRDDPLAIGVLPGAWLDDSVQSALLADGLPLLVASGSAFSGSLQAIVACLQSGVGQAALEGAYSQ